MISYDEWNKGIIEYFTSGVPHGAEVYLSLNEEAIADIGKSLLSKNHTDEDFMKDFIQSVRHKCLSCDRVYLGTIDSFGRKSLPQCVAFLGTMVLAANEMAYDETIDEVIYENNYFTRLRQILKLDDTVPGRPPGLKTGSEEMLWQNWNNWLFANGWISSAEQGEGALKYINYPLSQALLRKGDRERLVRIFVEAERAGKFWRNLDKDRLFIWLHKNYYQLSSHLINLLKINRSEAVTEAIYDVYTSIDWSCDLTAKGLILKMQRRITGGLYRQEDPITGELNYYLYPEQPRRFFTSNDLNIYVVNNGKRQPLRQERRGWFLPLWPVHPSCGTYYNVEGDSIFKELILPERGFWILIRDPENPDSGVFATWGKPGLGETFILLSHKKYKEQIELLKSENMINYSSTIDLSELDNKYDNWLEYQECMIMTIDWEGIIPQEEDLFDALKPDIKATIALKGGLRSPNQIGWLEEYSPEVTVFAFEDKIKLECVDISKYEIFFTEDIEPNKLWTLPSLLPGNYLLQAYSRQTNQLIARRNFRIISWDELEAKKPLNYYSQDLDSYRLKGAFLVKKKEKS